MSPLRHSRRFGDVRASSALAMKADIHHKARHVSKVPRAEGFHLSIGLSLFGSENDQIKE
jgi:hypothetical protein